MGAAKPCLGYPSRTAAVVGLRRQGLSTRQIADAIGIEDKTVLALELGSSRPRREPGPSAQLGRAIVIPVDVLNALGPHAAVRCMSVNPLLCGAVVVFCHNDQLPGLLPYLNGSFHRFCLSVWIKPNPSPMRNKHYLADTEPYIHAWNRGFAPVGEHHDMHRWHTCGTMPSKVFDHPTVKPLRLMEKIVRNVAGSTICDPFMGTGSTGVAAIRAGKVFTGIEHNPAHFETAVRRINDAWTAYQQEKN